MIIKTNHPHVSSSNNNISCTTLVDIDNDFKSLEELDVDVEIENVRKAEHDKYLQMQDYRRPKLQEGHRISTYRLNRSYSLKEMKQTGFQLKSEANSSQQKFPHHQIILSEFII